jgi:hypothetical protein
MKNFTKNSCLDYRKFTHSLLKFNKIRINLEKIINQSDKITPLTQSSRYTYKILYLNFSYT